MAGDDPEDEAERGEVEREKRFDSFYQETRRSLVHQTFALTGDLPAAQSAVRDAYVAAWHHWRKASALTDPQDWVRPRAWRLAQRRHTARIWHRSRGLSEQDKAVLDAIAKLSGPQRRVLVLTQLAAVPLDRAARELSLTEPAAQEQLQAATARFAVHLDTDSTAVRAHLESLADAAGAADLPRAPTVRRAGRKRRRRHTVLAAVGAGALAVGSGFLVQAPSRQPTADTLAGLVPGAAAPTTDGVAMPGTGAPQDAGATEGVAGGTTTAPAAPEGSRPPSADDLLDEDQISRLGPHRRWSVERTDDNTEGDGLNTICQQSRFADPDGRAALVRTFRATGRPRRTAVQTVETSRSAAQARKTFRTVVGWYAGCQEARLRLQRSYRVPGVGDQASVLMLRVWDRPVTSYSVAVARVGTVTTSTVSRTVGGPPPPKQEVVRSLADSVSMLCLWSTSPTCPKAPPHGEQVPPPAPGVAPGLLAVADLPPIADVDEAWSGTDPAPAKHTNPASTSCDRASFARGGARRARTRTFLIPEARLPDRFGLSETYGVFDSPRRARAFTRTLQHRLRHCEKHDLSIRVRPTDTGRTGHAGQAAGADDLSTWLLRIEVSAHETVRFRVGLVRVGRAVAQVTFAPTGKDDMSPAEFHEVVSRAGQRLREVS